MAYLGTYLVSKRYNPLRMARAVYRRIVLNPAFLAYLQRIGIPLHVRYVQAVTLEMTNVCNLRCPVCPVPLMGRVKGFMREEAFVKIIKKLPRSVKHIRLNYAGEPMLNKDIFKMIRTGKGLRPDISVMITTNATRFSEFDPHEIVDSGVDVIYVGIDGATKQTHEMYRVGSNFDEITHDVRSFCEYKRKVGAKKPKIIQQTLLHKRSIPEIDGTKELAANLGVDELALRYFTVPTLTCDLETLKRDWKGFSWVTPEVAESWKELYLPPEEYSKYERIPDGSYVLKQAVDHCTAVPLIMWNGDVTICCHDAEGQEIIGNLVRESWSTVMRRLPLWKIYTMQPKICEHCDVTNLSTNYSLIPVEAIQDKPRISVEAVH